MYLSTWLCPSPPLLIKGWFDYMEANYWSFVSHRLSKIIQMVIKRTPIQEQFVTNQCWGEFGCLLGELQGPKRHQIPTSTKNDQKSAKWSIHRDPNLKVFL